MAIREATPEDLPALLSLMRGYTDFYRADPSDDGLEEMIRDVIAAQQEMAFLLVATDDESGEVVGFALNQWKWSSLRGARVVVMDDLFVHPDARGKGYADALILAVGEVARRHGAGSIHWFTMPDNKRAQTVYDRVGGHAEGLIEYDLEL